MPPVTRKPIQAAPGKPKTIFGRSLRLAVTAVKKGKFKQLSRIAWRRTLRHFKTRTPLPPDAKMLGGYLEDYLRESNMDAAEKRSFVANGVHHYMKTRRQIGDADRFYKQLLTQLYNERAASFLRDYVGNKTTTVTSWSSVDEMEHSLTKQVTDDAIYYTLKYVLARYNAANEEFISTPEHFVNFWLEKWEWDKLSPEEQAKREREQEVQRDRNFRGQFRPAGRRS